MTMHRVLLKLSGEVLGAGAGGLDAEAVRRVCDEVIAVCDAGAQVGIVIGGGNILRGASGTGARFERTRSDRMGMLATLINCLALEDALRARGRAAQVLSAVPSAPFVEQFSVDRARSLLERGTVVLFGGGTGHPFFSTDTAASLRALQIGAVALLKGTKVDGVYDKDPNRFPDARRFDTLEHTEALVRNLRVMDQTALALCRENDLPIIVFDLRVSGNAARIVAGEPLGTRVETRRDDGTTAPVAT